MKKEYILILSFIVLIIGLGSVTGLFDLGFGSNIELTDETTDGICDIYDDTGQVYTTYYIIGVLKGLPDNVRDYNLKSYIYDEKGKLVGEDEDIVALEWVAESSKMNEPGMIGAITVEGFKNVSVYGLKIYNPDGKMIFEDNVTFSMDKVSFNHYNESDIDYGIIIEDFESYVEIISNDGSSSECSMFSTATIKNCPSDTEDYIVKTTYFDENHNKIGQSTDNLEDIIETGDENGDSVPLEEFGYCSSHKGDTTKYAVMSILLYDDEVANSTYELDEKDISHINEDNSDDSDSSGDSDTSSESSSSNGVKPHFRKFTDEENRQFEYYYNKYLADNG